MQSCIYTSILLIAVHSVQKFTRWWKTCPIQLAYLSLKVGILNMYKYNYYYEYF